MSPWISQHHAGSTNWQQEGDHPPYAVWRERRPCAWHACWPGTPYAELSTGSATAARAQVAGTAGTAGTGGAAMGTAAGGKTPEAPQGPESWLRVKLRNYFPHPDPRAVAALKRAVRRGAVATEAAPLFANPFAVDDLAIFDDETLRELLAGGAGGAAGLSPAGLAAPLHGAAPERIRRVSASLPA